MGELDRQHINNIQDSKNHKIETIYEYYNEPLLYVFSANGILYLTMFTDYDSNLDRTIMDWLIKPITEDEKRLYERKEISLYRLITSGNYHYKMTEIDCYNNEHSEVCVREINIDTLPDRELPKKEIFFE